MNQPPSKYGESKRSRIEDSEPQPKVPDYIQDLHSFIDDDPFLAFEEEDWSQDKNLNYEKLWETNDIENANKDDFFALLRAELTKK